MGTPIRIPKHRAPNHQDKPLVDLLADSSWMKILPSYMGIIIPYEPPINHDSPEN